MNLSPGRLQTFVWLSLKDNVKRGSSLTSTLIHWCFARCWCLLRMLQVVQAVLWVLMTSGPTPDLMKRPLAQFSLMFSFKWGTTLRSTVSSLDVQKWQRLTFKKTQRTCLFFNWSSHLSDFGASVVSPFVTDSLRMLLIFSTEGPSTFRVLNLFLFYSEGSGYFFPPKTLRSNLSGFYFLYFLESH